MTEAAKGLTLLEVVLALAAMSLVSIAVGGLLTQTVRLLGADEGEAWQEVLPLGEFADRAMADPRAVGWRDHPASTHLTWTRENGSKEDVALSVVWTRVPPVDAPGAEPRLGWCCFAAGEAVVLRRIQDVPARRGRRRRR